MTKFKPTKLHKLLFRLGLHDHCVVCNHLLQPHGYDDHLDCPFWNRPDHIKFSQTGSDKK